MNLPCFGSDGKNANTVMETLVDYERWLSDSGVTMPSNFKVSLVDWGVGVLRTQGNEEDDCPPPSAKKQKTGPITYKMTIPHNLLLHPHYQPGV